MSQEQDLDTRYTLNAQQQNLNWHAESIDRKLNYRADRAAENLIIETDLVMKETVVIE